MVPNAHVSSLAHPRRDTTQGEDLVMTARSIADESGTDCCMQRLLHACGSTSAACVDHLTRRRNLKFSQLVPRTNALVNGMQVPVDPNFLAGGH
jgi:hypothetical protein